MCEVMFNACCLNERGAMLLLNALVSSVAQSGSNDPKPGKHLDVVFLDLKNSLNFHGQSNSTLDTLF